MNHQNKTVLYLSLLIVLIKIIYVKSPSFLLYPNLSLHVTPAEVVGKCSQMRTTAPSPFTPTETPFGTHDNNVWPRHESCIVSTVFGSLLPPPNQPNICQRTYLWTYYWISFCFVNLWTYMKRHPPILKNNYFGTIERSLRFFLTKKIGIKLIFACVL